MKYTFESRVRFSEVDDRGYLSLPSLINYLMDCATFHGEEVGVGLDWIAEHKMTWVLASFRMKILRYPKFNTNIRVSTWATAFRGFLGYRDFLVETADGELLASGKSDWVYMDMKANQPLNVKEQAEAYGIEPDLALPEDFGRRKIRVKDAGEQQEPFIVHESNLDTNGHVNSGQYILLAQNYLPRSFAPQAVRAEYRKQAYLGETITPVVHNLDNGCVVELRNVDGDPYFIGAFTREDNE
ncbi:MAG: acyl-[Eubacterium sp.]|nr:acyl-[acyl-carrier-protein] thioesterase [Eubacterium sp.]